MARHRQEDRVCRARPRHCPHGLRRVDHRRAPAGLRASPAKVSTVPPHPLLDRRTKREANSYGPTGFSATTSHIGDSAVPKQGRVLTTRSPASRNAAAYPVVGT